MNQISNLLTTINNGYLAKKTKVRVANYQMNQRILAIFQKVGLIKQIKEDKENNKLVVGLPYSSCKIKPVSKSGRRVYCRAKKIPRPAKGLGLVIISTPKGVMTGEEARKINQGGEIICQVE